jgi:hypothetical protein
MAESLGSSPEESANHNAATGAAKPNDGKPHDNLPMVVAPKLGAGEEEVDEDEVAGEPDAAAPSSRFIVLAASVAFAAAFGSFVGSVSGSGLAHVLYPAAPAPASSKQNVNDAVRALKLELTNAIKADLDSATRSANAQLAKLGDRLDRLDPRAGAAPDVTGSIVPPAAAVPAKLTDRILEDWIVQDVQNGRALVESRYGGMFDVSAGSFLPGVGRVENVKRQDGQWIVITARGLITSGR